MATWLLIKKRVPIMQHQNTRFEADFFPNLSLILTFNLNAGHFVFVIGHLFNLLFAYVAILKTEYFFLTILFCTFKSSRVVIKCE